MDKTDKKEHGLSWELKLFWNYQSRGSILVGVAGTFLTQKLFIANFVPETMLLAKTAVMGPTSTAHEAGKVAGWKLDAGYMSPSSSETPLPPCSASGGSRARNLSLFLELYTSSLTPLGHKSVFPDAAGATEPLVEDELSPPKRRLQDHCWVSCQAFVILPGVCRLRAKDERLINGRVWQAHGKRERGEPSWLAEGKKYLDFCYLVGNVTITP